MPQQNEFGRPFSLKKHEEMFCDFAKTSVFFDEIIFLNFIWPHNHIFEFHLVPKMTSKSYFWISFEKRRFTKSLGIPNEIKHFFKTKSSFISFKSLTSLKTALKNYTWKVCVLPQQNAFRRPFSLKKHEEMFCDVAKSSSFFSVKDDTESVFPWAKYKFMIFQ